MRIEQIEDLLDEFDFGKVVKVTDCLEWTYALSKEAITIGDLRRTARRLLEGVYHMKDSPEECHCSGGFHAERRMFPGDSTKYLALRFVVTEWSNPVC